MAIVTGTSTATLQSPANRWTKAPTHVVVRNPLTGKWMGVLPSSGGFRLFEDIETSTTGTVLNANLGLRPSIAILPDGTGCTVVWASTGATIAWNTYLFSDPDVSVANGSQAWPTIASHDTCPLAATYDTNGALWLARASDDGLVRVSRLAGGVLTGPVQWGTFSPTQTGLICLAQVGSLMYGFSNGNDGSGRSAKTISLTAPDLAQANWTAETSSIPDLPPGTSSDDHLGLTVADDGTVYITGKTTNNDADLLLIYVLRRTPAGAYTMYDVEVGPDGGVGYSRPSIVLVNNEVQVYYGSINAPQDLSRKVAPVDTMAFGAREQFNPGPNYSDGAVMPVPGDIVAPSMPVLANERNGQVIHYWMVPVAATAIPSYQGAIPVTQAYLGTTDATKAYLGSTLVRQGG